MRLIKIAAASGAVVLCVAASALPTFDKVVAQQYKVKKDGVLAKASCGMCHVSKTKLKEYNPYGTDLKKVMDAAKTKVLNADLLKKVELLDSDKDGVKNGDELKAGTLPGDPKSK